VQLTVIVVVIPVPVVVGPAGIEEVDAVISSLGGSVKDPMVDR